MGKDRRRATILSVLLVALAVLVGGVAIVLLVLVPNAVRQRLEQELTRRELELVAVGRSTPWFGKVTVRDLAVRVRGAADVVSLKMPTIEVFLSGTSVTRVAIPELVATIDGTPSVIAAALDRVQQAQHRLPRESRHPMDVLGGSARVAVHTGVSGADVSLEFGQLAASIRFEPEDTRVRLERGKLRIGTLELQPLTTSAKVTAEARRLTVRAGPNKEASLEWSATAEEQQATFEAEGLPLAGRFVTGGKGAPQVELDHATWTGTGSFRSDGAAIQTQGDMRFDGLVVSPISVGPVSLRPGPRARVVWVGKGNEDTLRFDGSRMEVTLGGVARTLRLAGACTSLREEPALDLRWETGPIACAEVAQDVAAAQGAGLLAGLAGSFVRGSLVARGTLRGPLLETTRWKQDVTVVQGCTVEVPSPFR